LPRSKAEFLGIKSREGESIGKVHAVRLEARPAKIAETLETGMTADGDRVGGPMVEVVRSTLQLSAEDPAAMATYVKSLPAL
jgi:hypothetical protein